MHIHVICAIQFSRMKIKSCYYLIPGLHDIDAQSDPSTVYARWHGFVDLSSSIRFYTWCVGTSSAIVGVVCNVINATNVGLHVRAKAEIPSDAPSKTFKRLLIIL